MEQKSPNQTHELPLFSQPRERGQSLEPKHWSVSELTARIRGTLEPAFVQVWVQGEVSNYRPAASGHAYFSLKDQGACISAAMFGWGARKKSFDLKDGLQVLCRGKITIYPPRGSYQLVVDHLEPLGAGALQLAFEQLKAKLAREGLFDSAKKRVLPAFPKQIAVITSPSGAAIQDMLNILKRRAPQIKVVVIPALVQGDEAAGQIIRGIELAHQFSLGEVLVLARGGGSMEDLWCFNDENLARAIRGSKIPVISAVGHEIDFTISDFVADLRAPTPSAAAEIVSGHWVQVGQAVRDLKQRLVHCFSRDLQNRKSILAHIAARVVSPRDRLREQSQRTDELHMRLERALQVRLQQKRVLFEHVVGKMDALSPLKVLERGYSLVKKQVSDGDAVVVKSAAQVEPQDELEITFFDGTKKVRAL